MLSPTDHHLSRVLFCRVLFNSRVIGHIITTADALNLPLRAARNYQVQPIATSRLRAAHRQHDVCALIRRGLRISKSIDWF